MAVPRRRNTTAAPLPAHLAQPDPAAWVPPDARDAEPFYQAYRAFCDYTEALSAWHGDTVHAADKHLPSGADILDFLTALKNT